MTSFDVREASLADLSNLMDWRMEVLHHVFDVPESDPMEELRVQNERYYREALPEGRHIACFAEKEDEIIGCGGICIYDEMPSPDNPMGKCAYLMNIYTRKPYRGQGAGRMVVEFLVGRVRSMGITKIYLESSEAGRSLYEKAGFTPMSDYMILSSWR